jgi:hypothetical protein
MYCEREPLLSRQAVKVMFYSFQQGVDASSNKTKYNRHESIESYEKKKYFSVFSFKSPTGPKKPPPPQPNAAARFCRKPSLKATTTH